MDFIKYRILGDNGGFTELATIEEIPAGVAYETIVVPTPSQQEIDAKRQKKALELETEKYKQRMSDGQAKYAEISAKFRLLKFSGIINEDSQREIESLLKPVRNEVLAGQWIDALIQLELLEQTTISIGKHDLYIEIWNIINEYIQYSYTSYEIANQLKS